MIQYIRGEVTWLEQDRAVIDVNGMGYGVYMPTRVLNEMHTGDEVMVYTYLSVREDAMLLFGFLDREDLLTFRLLLNVNGIGPKAAIGVLSGLSSDDLKFAVLADDVKTISTAPGIGKKTAQKMILELKDKFNLEETFEHSLAASNTAAKPGSSSSAASGNKADAIEILQQWGYSASDALKAVNKLDNLETLSVEEILQMTLKIMR